MIELQDVSKRFGRRVALSGVSFVAPPAAITGLMGPNGAGKTTLLRILAGLLRPDMGSASLAGTDPQAPAVHRLLGVLTEAQGLYARLSVREHLRFAGGLHGLAGAALERRIDEVLELLDLRSLGDERTAGFSRGQQTRVSLARTRVHGPSVLLLDEPTSALDIPSARAVRAALRQLRDQGACILLASHVMSELEELADGLILLAEGRVVATGTADELRAQTRQARLEDAFVVATTWGNHQPPTSDIRTQDEQGPDWRGRADVWTRDVSRNGITREAIVVARKEILDYWRDGPAQLTRVLLLVVSLVALVVPLYVFPRQILQAYLEPLRVGVVGAERAPALMAYLAEQQIVVTPPPADPVGAVQGGGADLVLVVPAEYAESLAAGQPAELLLVADTARPASNSARQYVSSVLVSYGQRLARARALARGLDPTVLTPVQVALEDVRQQTSVGAFERGLAPTVVLTSILIFGLTSGALAVQLTAGERERRTLEPLLCETSRRASLALGKTAAALSFGLLPSGLLLLGLAVALPLLPLGSVLGVPSAAAVLEGLGGLVLVAPPVVVVQMLVVAAFPGSADASGGRMVVLTLALIATGIVTVSSAPFGVPMHAIPVVGQLAVMDEALLGMPPSPAASLLAVTSSLAALAGGLWLLTRLYSGEAIARA